MRLRPYRGIYSRSGSGDGCTKHSFSRAVLDTALVSLQLVPGSQGRERCGDAERPHRHAGDGTWRDPFCGARWRVGASCKWTEQHPSPPPFRKIYRRGHPIRLFEPSQITSHFNSLSHTPRLVRILRLFLSKAVQLLGFSTPIP